MPLQVRNMKQNKPMTPEKTPGAFAGYLAGIGIVLLMMVFLRFGEMKSLAEDLFAPKYDTAEELIRHGLDNLENVVPSYYLCEDEDGLTIVKLNYPGKEGYPLLISTKGEEKLLGRPYRWEKEKVGEILTGTNGTSFLSIRENALYQIKNECTEDTCYLFDFTITEEEYRTFFDIPYFTEKKEVAGDKTGSAYVAIDPMGYIKAICFEAEGTKQTIGYQKK